MSSANNDTIAAVSTSSGEGGIGIVRLSGKDSSKIADKIFASPAGRKPSSCESHTVHYGHIETPNKKEMVDEVLLTVMRGPKSYTTEDVVEISCHGGSVSLKKVLKLCLDEGARLAEPGEFTKRAFLNGRIDLAQAEAVLDIIKAETDTSQRMAIGHLGGDLSREVKEARNSIIDILSFIELTIDFSDEDVKPPSVLKIARSVKSVNSLIEELLKNSEKGIILRQGASVVICGRPNVGKSSLMNALLKHDRVIVTSVPGTTRDTIEESINIAGVGVKISDTAGIIETEDTVEIEGIKRSREKLTTADIVIFVLDRSQSLSAKDEEIYETIKDKNVIIVTNKADLPRKIDAARIKEWLKGKNILEVSALKKKGLERLEDRIAAELFKGDCRMSELPMVANLRHKKILEKAKEATERAIEVIDADYNGELLASDLNEAVYCLGLVVGESIEDDILDRIFSQFCIGK